MTSQTNALIQACKVQAESCQYTAAGFYVWLNAAKWHNRLWNALPIVFGATASFSLLKETYPHVAPFFALLAGLTPAIYEKLKLKSHTDEILCQAGQYKNLENRFTHAAEIIGLDKNPDALKVEFDSLMRQMEDLRARPVVMPEKYFLKAREKIMSGHFRTDVAHNGNANMTVDNESLNHRQHLVLAAQKAQEDYDKAILSLSGGALGVSFSFLHEILGNASPQKLCLLTWAWILWGLSIASIIASYFCSRVALNKAIEEVDKCENSGRPGGLMSFVTEFFNIVGGLSFVVGVVLITFFANVNLQVKYDVKQQEETVTDKKPPIREGYIPPAPPPKTQQQQQQKPAPQNNGGKK